MKKNVKTKMLTEADLQRLAESGDAKVMTAKYDKEFKPWDVAKLDQLIQDVCHHTRSFAEGIPPSEVEEKAKKVARFREFENLYPTVFKKLCSPSFINDDRSMQMLKMMLIRRSEVDSGRLSQEEANKKVANDTLMVMAAAARNEAEDD